MAMNLDGTRPNRIQLKTTGRYDEAVADGAVKPGMLVDANGVDANGRPKYRAHPTAGGAAELVIALESPLDEGGTIDTAFANGDFLPIEFVNAGDEVFALLEGNADYTYGAALASAGDGAFKLAGAGDIVLAEMVEALDLTGDQDDHGKVRARHGLGGVTTTTTTTTTGS